MNFKSCFALLGAVLLLSEAQAQHWSFSMGAGAGKSYIVESLQGRLDFYGPAFSMKSSLQYQPQESDYSIGLNFTAMHTNVNFFPGPNAYSSNTISVGVSRNLEFENWSFGYGFGMGVTHETARSTFTFQESQKRFATVSTDCFVERNISERLSIILSLNALWFDPIGSFMPAQWEQTGEDVNSLGNICLKVKI